MNGIGIRSRLMSNRIRSTSRESKFDPDSCERGLNVDVDLVGRKVKAMVRNKRGKKLRLATWNFSGLCSDRKQKEIEELLAKHNLDVADQESNLTNFLQRCSTIPIAA